MRSICIATMLLTASSLIAQPVVGTDITHFGCQTVWPSNGSLGTFLDRAVEAGIDTVRCDATWWGLIEYPNAGEYHWDGSAYPGYSAWNVDNWVSQVTSRGLEPYVILGNNNSGLYNQPPSTPTDFAGYAAYCADAAARYADDVDIWELWNEPNIPLFWGGTPNAANYTSLVVAAAPAIRAQDPTAIIVGGATSGMDFSFLTTCFDNGMLNYVDVVSVHPYRTTAPETVAADIATLRSLMNSYTNGSNVEIWTGEWGYNSYFSEVNEEGHAKCVLRMMVNNPSAGVQHSTWFSMHAFQELDPGGTDSEWGLLNRDLTRRPAFYAMQTLNEHLPAPVNHISDPYSTSHSPTRSNQQTRVFERGSSDNRTSALWLARWPVNSTFSAERTTVTMTLASPFEVRAFDGLTGNEIPTDVRRSGAQTEIRDLVFGDVGMEMWDYPVLVDIDRETLPGGDNVALNAVNFSSDTALSGFDPNLACDGVVSVASKWTSDSTAGAHWLAIELDDEYLVTGAAVRYASMAGEYAIYNATDIEFQTGPSITGPWTTQATDLNTNQHDRAIAEFASPVATRFVRLLINDAGTDNYARIPEFEVYAASAVPAELSAFVVE